MTGTGNTVSGAMMLCLLGEYATADRAKEVLAEIAKTYAIYSYQEPYWAGMGGGGAGIGVVGGVTYQYRSTHESYNAYYMPEA